MPSCTLAPLLMLQAPLSTVLTAVAGLHSDRLIYEWLDKDGNARTSAWSKAVRNAMRQGEPNS